MKLLYIESTNGIKYTEDEFYKFTDKPNDIEQNCKITKLWFGKYKITYFDPYNSKGEYLYSPGDEINNHNTVIIIYPNGIKEIKYTKENI